MEVRRRRVVKSRVGRVSECEVVVGNMVVERGVLMGVFLAVEGEGNGACPFAEDLEVG